MNSSWILEMLCCSPSHICNHSWRNWSYCSVMSKLDWSKNDLAQLEKIMRQITHYLPFSNKRWFGRPWWSGVRWPWTWWPGWSGAGWEWGPGSRGEQSIHGALWDEACRHVGVGDGHRLMRLYVLRLGGRRVRPYRHVLDIILKRATQRSTITLHSISAKQPNCFLANAEIMLKSNADFQYNKDITAVTFNEILGNCRNYAKV